MNLLKVIQKSRYRILLTCGELDFFTSLCILLPILIKKDSEKLKNTFHQLFEKYQIDPVLSGHTQYYQRSFPLSYNNYNAIIPVVMDQNNNEYNNQDGIIFVTASTAGDKIHKITYFLPYYTIQKGKFGFLNFDLKNNGHTLTGTFYDTDDLDILDRFVISKDSNYQKGNIL